jgi:hypothetical protein
MERMAFGGAVCGHTESRRAGIIAISHLLYSLSSKWEKSDFSCAFDGSGQRSLMSRAVSAYSSREYLTPIRHEFAQPVYVFIIDKRDFVYAETTDFPAHSFELRRSSWGCRHLTFLLNGDEHQPSPIISC